MVDVKVNIGTEARVTRRGELFVPGQVKVTHSANQLRPQLEEEGDWLLGVGDASNRGDGGGGGDGGRNGRDMLWEWWRQQ